jgi:hypothetical protein
MKFVLRLSPLVFLILSAFAPIHSDNVEFSCVKTHKATNTCHFNFKVDGAKYRFVDIGCRYKGKSTEVINKAKDGTIALARDWKIECSEIKAKKQGEGF